MFLSNFGRKKILIAIVCSLIFLIVGGMFFCLGNIIRDSFNNPLFPVKSKNNLIYKLASSLPLPLIGEELLNKEYKRDELLQQNPLEKLNLYHPDPFPLQLEAISERGQRSVSFIKVKLFDRRIIVRRNAIEVLNVIIYSENGNIDSKIIEKKLKDTDWYIRAEAAKLLSLIFPKNSSRMIKIYDEIMAKEKNGDVRKAMLFSLCQNQTQKSVVIPRLKGALQDKYKDVRNFAYYYCERHSKFVKECYESLLIKLKKGQDIDKYYLIGDALIGINKKKTKKDLIQLYGNLNNNNKKYLIEDILKKIETGKDYFDKGFDDTYIDIKRNGDLKIKKIDNSTKRSNKIIPADENKIK